MELLLLAMVAAAGGMFLFDSSDDTPDPVDETCDTEGTTVRTIGTFSITQTEDGAATLCGSAGNDIYESLDGNGGEVADYIAENDLFLNGAHGGNGDDTLAFDHLAELETGATISGDAGNDSIFTTYWDAEGGDGNDTIHVHTAGDVLADGGAGDDVLSATSISSEIPHRVAPLYDFELHGGEGNDTLSGFAGDFHGDDGNDHILVDGTLSTGSVAEGGAGDDTIALDRMVHAYNPFDDRAGIVEFTSGDFELTGGEGADRFEINADIRYVRDVEETMLFATITDFTPDEDVLSFSYETGDEHPYISWGGAPPDTTDHELTYSGLSEASDGSYTDVTFSVTGISEDDGTPITQEFAIRLEGVTGLDPNSITVDPDNGEILIG